MITNTKLAVISDNDSLLKALKDVVFQVRTFSLNIVDLNALFDHDIRAQILPVPAISMMQRAVLLAHVDGYQRALIDSIRATECQFVYRSSTGALYSTKVGTKWPHFSAMTMAMRATATTGYVWKDSGAPFSIPTKVAVKEAV